MNTIKVLPEILANKIAAGEIVERPASVIKEFVENSLDAESRAIYVAVASGGKRSIRVRDDGEGMSPDDALLAFEHHAISKLRTAEDLASIATLGFRGEALPSIASISRLTLRTRREEDSTGTEIEIHGGVLRSVKPIPWNRGTEIEARDLFYNVPARRKFLRAQDTELGHIARLVTNYALARPETRFTLESDGRTLLDVTAVPNIKDRIFQTFGDGFYDCLIPFDGHGGNVRAHGFTSLPDEHRTNSFAQYIYVNRRMVRDKVLMGAIRQAYRNYIPSAAYPVTILFLELPFDEVDVNAHPAKTEVRFRDQNAVHRLTFETIDRALKENAVIPSYTHRSAPPFLSGGITDSAAEKNDYYGAPADPGFPRVADDISPSAALPMENSAVADSFAAHWNLMEANDRRSEQPYLDFPRTENYFSASAAIAPNAFGKNPDPAAVRQAAELLLSPAQHNTRGGLDLSNTRILGQMRNSYIIACDAHGLIIVDQHAAHERILYEKLAAEMLTGRIETQGLLIPLSIELTPAQMALIERALPELARNGFDAEPFGGTSIIVRAVPAIARDADIRALITEITGALDDDERCFDIEKIRERIAVKTACKAAVKVNMPLGPEKMRWLLDELAQASVPTNCPHGRPAILRFSLSEIEKNFGR
jgi:DNA mismatch repair protein MutL